MRGEEVRGGGSARDEYVDLKLELCTRLSVCEFQCTINEHKHVRTALGGLAGQLACTHPDQEYEHHDVGRLHDEPCTSAVVLKRG